MNRRGFMLSSAAAGAVASPLARPAIGGTTKTLVCVPQNPLSSLDPVWSSQQITRNMGFMVFDLLYGRDEQGTPRPQMVESDLMEDGGRRWTMRLRDGLWFHDGEKVLARDCVASLKRWMKRDQGGATLAQRIDALEAADDRTIVLRLSKPFPHLRTLLSKFIVPAAMMPERLALTDPFKQIPEAIGSGPFRWLAKDHIQGSFAAFARNDRYVSREEPPSYMAGGHPVNVDRVEWKMITDGATAANALVTGEVDWIEIPLPDLLPMLKRAPGVKTGILDEGGQLHFMRPNHTLAPTNNPAIRRAMAAALDQREIMTAVIGGDPANMIVDVGFLNSPKPEVKNAGMELIRKRHTTTEVKAMLDKAGYRGERLVLLHPTDHTYYNPSSAITAQMLRDVGMNIDDQMMDWGTVQSRRTSREPLDRGGWSIFNTVAPMPDYSDPLLALFARGEGKTAWFGWPDDPKIEGIFETWLGATDPAEQTRLERDFQLQAFETLPFIPLGGYKQTSAWRDNLTGILKGPSIVFWNVRKN
jgi:peptide/nickel transport system substrate-binding protein